MPTQTDPRLLFVARDLDSPTTSFPAHRTTTSSPDEDRPAGSSKLDAALHGARQVGAGPSAPLADEPGELDYARPVSVLAAQLHRGTPGGPGCDCDYPGDVDGHGVDFEAWADEIRAGVLDDAEIPSGIITIPAPTSYPVETKVAVGGWASLAVGVGLALANLLLARLDLLPSLLGGPSPWVGALVLVLGATLPAAIAHLKMFYAPHSPRPDFAAVVERIVEARR